MVSNQLKRQDDEMKSLLEKLDTAERQDREHQAKIKDHERRYADLEAKVHFFRPSVTHLCYSHSSMAHSYHLANNYD